MRPSIGRTGVIRGGVKGSFHHYTSGDDITIDATGGAVMGNGDYMLGDVFPYAKKDVWVCQL